jgi:hypothetical protein
MNKKYSTEGFPCPPFSTSLFSSLFINTSKALNCGWLEMVSGSKKEAEISRTGSFQIPPPAYEDESISGVPPARPSSSVGPLASNTPKPNNFLAAFLSPFSRRIRASDTPQWAWSNSQCREWLTAVLIEYCNRDPVVARETADKMFADGGFGPRLYTTKLVTWERFVGVRDAECIHGLLVSLRKEKGAVPASVKIDVS